MPPDLPAYLRGLLAVRRPGSAVEEASESAVSVTQADHDASIRVHRPGWMRRRTLWILFTLLATVLFLYFQVFVFPTTPRAATGDQSIYLHSAARMYEGQLLYRDYDQLTFPGTDALYLALFKLFGIRAWIPQVMLILAGVASAWLSILIASKVMSGPAVFLPGCLFLTMPYSSYLDATHHLYSALAGTSALAVVIKRRTNFRLAWAGLLWGIATCFTQSMILGPLAFGIFLIWEQRREGENGRDVLKKQGCLLGAYAATLAGFISYFVWKAGARQFVISTMIFVAQYFSTYQPGSWKTYMLGWPSWHHWVNWPDLPAWPLIHLLIPLVYILFFVRYWRTEKSNPNLPWARLMLINATGLCFVLTVASAPAWNRLYTVSLPAMVILVWFLTFPFRLEQILRRLAWVGVVVLVIARPIVTQTRWRASLDLPTGRTAIFEPGWYEETKWLLRRTHPSDYFFGDQLVCFSLRLRNPSRLAYVTPYPFTRPKEVADLVQQLETRKVQFVSWYPGLEAPTDAPGNSLAPLRRELSEHYHVAAQFSNGNKVWERNWPGGPRTSLANSMPE